MLGQVDSQFSRWFVRLLCCFNLLVVPFDLVIFLFVNVAVLVWLPWQKGRCVIAIMVQVTVH